jgi:hypothetical protein
LLEAHLRPHRTEVVGDRKAHSGKGNVLFVRLLDLSRILLCQLGDEGSLLVSEKATGIGVTEIDVPGPLGP